ncbi:MAG: hypothetical protein J0L62_09535 [Bacteroidetes bacterium]|nr:hypothetical protein [Bacteroidota bacterium]
MPIELIVKEFEELKAIEEKLLSNTLEHKQDYWNKVTHFTQILVKFPNLKTSDYEQYKAELEASINRVKNFQAERERKYIALKEQMHYNKIQVEKELEPLAEKHSQLTGSEHPEFSMELYNNLVRLQKRVRILRPLDRVDRENFDKKLTELLSSFEEQKKAARESRLSESDSIKDDLFARIDAQIEALTASVNEKSQDAYDRFFQAMEGIKAELANENLVKKHVDALWKKWKKSKEDAKELLSGVYTANHDVLEQELEAFAARLPEIKNPKEAFGQYKALQKKAIELVMKRRQKDKIFKRFKTLWTDLQTQFESFQQEAEKQKQYREQIQQKETEKKVQEKSRVADDLREQLAQHQEAKAKLQKEIKNSDRSTFIRKAQEVLEVQENMIAEITRKLDRLEKDSHKAG